MAKTKIINNFVTIWVDRHKRKRLKLWTVTQMKMYVVFAAKNQEIIASWFLIKYMDVSMFAYLLFTASPLQLMLKTEYFRFEAAYKCGLTFCGVHMIFFAPCCCFALRGASSRDMACYMDISAILLLRFHKTSLYCSSPLQHKYV